MEAHKDCPKFVFKYCREYKGDTSKLSSLIRQVCSGYRKNEYLRALNNCKDCDYKQKYDKEREQNSND